MSSFAARPFGTTLPAYLRYATDKMITRVVLAHGILAFSILVSRHGCCWRQRAAVAMATSSTFCGRWQRDGGRIASFAHDGLVWFAKSANPWWSLGAVPTLAATSSHVEDITWPARFPTSTSISFRRRHLPMSRPSCPTAVHK